jgi:ubiquitin carboxyl-terminal hydrolase 22/27/51
MSVRTLPQVLAIQLKRFEHLLGSFSAGAGKPAKVKGEGRKVDTFVRIPVHLDMQGYTSDGVRKRRLRSDAIQHSQAQDSMTSPLMSPSASSASLAAWAQSGENEEEDLSKVHPDPGYQYTLFAVIEHLGKLDSGHYRAYVKSRGQVGFILTLAGIFLPPNVLRLPVVCL